MVQRNQSADEKRQIYVSSFLAGGVAGFIVDVSLFPLDTIKTRLQAEQGFRKSGGFNGVYKGIGPQIVGSVPQAALFFLTYESLKYVLEPLTTSKTKPFAHMISASAGEMVACFIRVPMEVIKQRRQTSINMKDTSTNIFLKTYKQEGIKGLYRGYGSTVLREIPFSFIQFPLLEFFKSYYRKTFKNNIPLEPFEVATCGALAGSVAAAATTPLDVVKTRIMLADKKLAKTGGIGVRNMFMTVYREKGLKGLFAGFGPRVTWISIGGYIFFGTYDMAKTLCNTYILGIDPDFPLI
ncbi:hypothetical protein WA026_000506 [Henosepilachna vigintioctopunctata]|uniref:S-adenosylmethionine mitochondrial carrier protein n=1 Tax=Henosepilachna vigintioctopunctata TaxID=420089 RepID=A0AAW1V7T2_9CUCU